MAKEIELCPITRQALEKATEIIENAVAFVNVATNMVGRLSPDEWEAFLALCIACEVDADPAAPTGLGAS